MLVKKQKVEVAIISAIWMIMSSGVFYYTYAYFNIDILRYFYLLIILQLLTYYYVFNNKLYINKTLLFFYVFIVLWTLLIQNNLTYEDLNVNFKALLTYGMYLLIFSFGYHVFDKLNIKVLEFFIYIYIFIGIVFFVVLKTGGYSAWLNLATSYFNINWISIFALYSIFIVYLKNGFKNNFYNIFKLFIILLFTYYSFDSTGTSLMIVVFVLFLYGAGFIIKIFGKYTFLLYLLIGIYALNFIISYLYIPNLDTQAALSSYYKSTFDTTTKFFSGRELDYFRAYEYLLLNNEVFGAHEQIGEMVKNLHFSFFDISLRYSIFSFLILVLFLNSIYLMLIKINDKRKMILSCSILFAISLAIFVYNGFAPTHIPINTYSFFLLGILSKYGVKNG